MRPSRLFAGLSLGAAAALAGSLVAAPGASAATGHGPAPTGTRPLAQVLAADTGGFDHDPDDYDILTAAVQAVLKAKPSSKVAVLADGTTPLTAFLPDDRAFRLLVKDLTGKTLLREREVFGAVAKLGIPTVETVLLYHVVPGATIDSKAALKSDGARLKTAQGGTITVDVRRSHGRTSLVLVDADRTDRDPRGNRFDLNKGNKQIAHGIDRVLRPVDLP